MKLIIQGCQALKVLTQNEKSFTLTDQFYNCKILLIKKTPNI